MLAFLGLSSDYQSLARWFLSSGSVGVDFYGFVSSSFPDLVPYLTCDFASGSSLFLAALRSPPLLSARSFPPGVPAALLVPPSSFSFDSGCYSFLGSFLCSSVSAHACSFSCPGVLYLTRLCSVSGGLCAASSNFSFLYSWGRSFFCFSFYRPVGSVFSLCLPGSGGCTIVGCGCPFTLFFFQGSPLFPFCSVCFLRSGFPSCCVLCSRSPSVLFCCSSGLPSDSEDRVPDDDHPYGDPSTPPLSLDSSRSEYHHMIEYIIGLFPQAAGAPPLRPLFESFITSASPSPQPLLFNLFDSVRQAHVDADARMSAFLAVGRCRLATFLLRFMATMCRVMLFLLMKRCCLTLIGSKRSWMLLPLAPLPRLHGLAALAFGAIYPACRRRDDSSSPSRPSKKVRFDFPAPSSALKSPRKSNFRD